MGSFWALFVQIWAKNKFSWNKGLCQLLNISLNLILCHKLEKTNEQFLRKMLNCWTDRQQWFYRTLRRSSFTKTTFSFFRIYFNTPKTSLFHQFFREIQTILESCDQSGQNHLWPHPPQYFSINLQFWWICINMQKIRLFHHFALEIFALKILQSDWLRGFRAISHEPKCPQIWDLFKHTAININFHYRQKMITKLSYTFKEPSAWPFWGQNIIFKKSGSVMHNNTWAPNTMLSFRKN